METKRWQLADFLDFLRFLNIIKNIHFVNTLINTIYEYIMCVHYYYIGKVKWNSKMFCITCMIYLRIYEKCLNTFLRYDLYISCVFAKFNRNI